MLNRRINSCRASIACSGFIRLSTFSRRSLSIAASSRTSWFRAFHFAYLPQPMPSASRVDRIQTVTSVVVTESISATYKSRSSFAKASIPVPVLISLSVAQSMAIRAPLPEYPHEAKRRDGTGNGVCVIAIDPVTWKVTDASMEPRRPYSTEGSLKHSKRGSSNRDHFPKSACRISYERLSIYSVP